MKFLPLQLQGASLSGMLLGKGKYELFQDAFGLLLSKQDFAVREGLLEHGLLTFVDFISFEVQLGQFAKTCNWRDGGDLVLANPECLQFD